MFIIVTLVLTAVTAVVLQDIGVHPTISALIPALTIAVNWVVAHTEIGASLGKRNVTAALSLPLAVLNVSLLGIDLPELSGPNGDLINFFVDLQAWGLVVGGVWLSTWKSQAILYDLMQGQAGTPEAIANRLRGVRRA